MTVTLEHVTQAVDGIPTIRDVSLTLERGTLSVLLGPTLSGKTSIMRLLAGLDKPTTGRVLVDGNDVTGIDVRRRSVAMVYQQFINYPSFTVYDNIASPLRVQGKSRAEIDKRVQEAARLLKLEPYLDRMPLQLSGGQQQRTAIARALVKGADLVLLDEPLANLDYKLREELRTELPRIFEASGAIFVYATTEPSEALLLGGRSICMWEGEILQVGDTPTVYRHPATMRVAQVFSDPPLNIVGIEKSNGSVQYAGGVQAPASGLYAAARRRRLPGRFPRPPTRGRQRCGRPPRIFRHRDGDGNHRLGKLRASPSRRLQLGRGAAGRARISARICAGRGARSGQSLCIRSGRPSGRRARRGMRDMQHGPH